jgi:hypothetical protein
MSPGEGALLGEPRGRGEGRRNVDSSLSGDDSGFLSEPGGFAVFMLEYGLNFFFAVLSSGVLPRELHPSSRYPNSLYPWNGLRKTLFDLDGAATVVGGETLRRMGAGWNFSSRTWTKLEGNRPTMRRSRLSRPIHQDPSPALRHSIRSPSMKPRSFLLCRDGQPLFALLSRVRVVPHLSTP